MKKFSQYDNVEINRFKKIKAGLYKGKIVGVRVDRINTRSGIKEILRVCFDIAEGEFTDFFKNKYNREKSKYENKTIKWSCKYDFWLESSLSTKEENEKAAEKFKRFINYLNYSNEGFEFDWDEKKLIGKKIGLVFGLEEFIGYDGKVRAITKLRNLTSVQKVEKFDPSDTSIYPNVKLIDNTYISYITYIKRLNEMKKSLKSDYTILDNNSNIIY